MAKKKHGKRHHRRVGASLLNPRSPLIMIGALAAGYFLGDTINTAIDKFMPTTSGTSTISSLPTIIMVGELGLGGLLLLKKRKTLITTAAGGILAGAGIRRALKAAGMVTGYQSVPVIGRRMGAYQSVPVIGGVPAQLAGVPSQLQGFRVNGAGNNGYVPVGSGTRVMGSVGPVAGGAAYQTAYSGGSGYMN
jgi:hypothetical protein